MRRSSNERVRESVKEGVRESVGTGSGRRPPAPPGGHTPSGTYEPQRAPQPAAGARVGAERCTSWGARARHLRTTCKWEGDAQQSTLNPPGLRSKPTLADTVVPWRSRHMLRVHENEHPPGPPGRVPRSSTHRRDVREETSRSVCRAPNEVVGNPFPRRRVNRVPARCFSTTSVVFEASLQSPCRG